MYLLEECISVGAYYTVNFFFFVNAGNIIFLNRSVFIADNIFYYGLNSRATFNFEDFMCKFGMRIAA